MDEGLPFLTYYYFFKRVAESFTFNPPALVRVCVPGRNGGGEGRQENRLVNIPSSAKRGKKTSERARAKNTVKVPVG